MWRCDEIRQRYRADAYILLRCGHRYYEYNSTDRIASLLPSMGLVSYHEAYGILTINRSAGEGLPHTCCA